MNDEKLLKIIYSTISTSLQKVLTGYNSPLDTVIRKVMEQYAPNIEASVKASIDNLFNTEGFKDNIRKALDDKLAKTLISKIGGEIERQVTELNRDPGTRAKIKLAILECLKQ